MEQYVIVKLETKAYAKSYDDIKPDKYLYELRLKESNYPYKSWCENVENAIIFYRKEYAKAAIELLRSNTPYVLKIEEI